MSLSFFTWKMGSQYLLCFVAIRIKEKTNTNQLAPNPQWVLNKFESISLVSTLKGHSNIKPQMTSDCSHEIKTFAPWKRSYDKPRQGIKKQRHYFADKCPHGQNYDFSSSQVWMWELGHNEGWAPKNWCFWTVMFEEDSWESLGQQRDQTSQS